MRENLKKCVKIRVKKIKKDFGKSLSFLSKKRLILVGLISVNRNQHIRVQEYQFPVLHQLLLVLILEQ